MLDKAINQISLQDFKTHLHGELIAPGNATYDPTNFFHLNNNIKPTGEP